MNKVVKAMMTSIWPASSIVGAEAEADVLEGCEEVNGKGGKWERG